nr:immunoglobulin heavy chain junction region [Macaca mulatta]MOW77787.1 immunoglobulin heavy chain junction region [Macaca mulatta]MOW77904.1 immunoglobulin heavy chain junction region [Macaca mulatta]MOW79166.1 immunoglobulin heavy chain junction region [Macaca mulatta]MOW80977.1 immunoglobulin heavy chain junction region [Macaca mulatta]
CARDVRGTGTDYW